MPPTGRTTPANRAAFQEVLEQASAATVRVLADGEEVALGTVVEPDGYLVTKASVLKGKITCRFRDGTERPAEKVGNDDTEDLALLRVQATGLPAITWREGVPAAGKPGGDHRPRRLAGGHRRGEHRAAKDSWPARCAAAAGLAGRRSWRRAKRAWASAA